jgi:hypothetical protein
MQEAIPLPNGFLSGTPFSDVGAHSKNLSASLAEYEEQTGGQTNASDIDGFRAAVKPLAEEAKKLDREFSPELLKLVRAQGGEHSVVFAPGRVLKFTEPDTAGGVVKFSSDGEPSVSHGTAPEYAKQLELNRDLFADDTRIEGVMSERDGGIRIVTSQTAIHGVKPSYEEVSRAFLNNGYMPVDQEWVNGQEGPELWWSKAENIGIADAKPDNLVKTADGDIVPIDIKAFRPTGRALEWMKENGNSLALAKHQTSQFMPLGEKCSLRGTALAKPDQIAQTLVQALMHTMSKPASVRAPLRQSTDFERQ